MTAHFGDQLLASFIVLMLGGLPVLNAEVQPTAVVTLQSEAEFKAWEPKCDGIEQLISLLSPSAGTRMQAIETNGWLACVMLTADGDIMAIAGPKGERPIACNMVTKFCDARGQSLGRADDPNQTESLSVIVGKIGVEYTRLNADGTKTILTKEKVLRAFRLKRTVPPEGVKFLIVQLTPNHKLESPENIKVAIRLNDD